jgi:hypothetical protein
VNAITKHLSRQQARIPKRELPASHHRSQVASRYYEAMICEIANASLENRRSSDESSTQIIKQKTSMEGKYNLTIEGLEENGVFTNFKVHTNLKLPTNLIRGIAVYGAREMNLCGEFSVTGYTSCKLNIDDRLEIFRCTSRYGQDGQWYDWCLIDWEISSNNVQTYPGLVLGFIEVGIKHYAVVQSSNDPMSTEIMTEHFVCKFTMPEYTPASVIDIGCISSPLCVFKNYGGSKSEYFCALPQRMRSRFFGDRIVIP